MVQRQIRRKGNAIMTVPETGKLVTMNTGIKAKWVEALRSGEYKQGKGYLKTDIGFCCLGVLCDLHSKETNLQSNWDVRHTTLINHYLYGNNFGSLPPRVVIWSGFNSQLVEDVLAKMNDHDNYTFKQIADYIEKAL